MQSPWKNGGWRLLLAMPFLVSASEILGPVQPVVKVPYKLEAVTSIPYPSGAIYLSHGIYTTLSGGKHYNYGDPLGLYQWQGELGYYYTPWFSGGAGFKMIAGQPSDSRQIIRNRFFLLSRFHKSWSRFATYAGVQIGVDDVNISLSPINDSSDFRAPLQKINAGAGLELGVGWKFSKYVSATLGGHFDASFVGDDTTNFEGSANFRIVPGLALDVLAIAPSLRKNVKAFYVFSDLQFGQLLLENKSHRQDFASMTGVSLGF